MRKVLLSLLLCYSLSWVQAQTTHERFIIEPISDAIFQRINGKSFKENPTIRRSDLRLLRLQHYDGEGIVREGEIICNKSIAQDLKEIFEELFRQKYRIERIRLIDEYGADDETSMRANNTYCFCYRKVAGSNKLSKHAQGLAIDINPLYNPCVKTGKDGRRIVQPATAGKYTNRKKTFPYKIDRNDLCYRLFIQHGFTWGGNWRSLKDYQHFEK